MNMFAKLEEGRLIICPRNGYVGKTAISNIDLYFEKNPEIAEKETYLKSMSSCLQKPM